jgi:hypothetical protein
MSQRLMTPSKVTAWLECPHYLTLRSQVDRGLIAEPQPTFGSFARLLADKGLSHEQDCLAEYRRQGKSVFEVPPRHERESFAAWVHRVSNPFGDSWDVVYQMPFIHGKIRGIADFVVRVVDSDSGEVFYEPVDAKLTRVDAKPGHVLQLCFYFANHVASVADLVVPAYPTEWVYGSTATPPGRRLGILSKVARWSRTSPQVRRGLQSTVGGLW